MRTCDDVQEPFQHGVRHSGEGEFECCGELLVNVVNGMLSRAFFAYLHLNEIVQILVCIHGKKK